MSLASVFFQIPRRGALARAAAALVVGLRFTLARAGPASADPPVDPPPPDGPQADFRRVDANSDGRLFLGFHSIAPPYPDRDFDPTDDLLGPCTRLTP